MISKLFPFLFVLVRLAFTSAEDEFSQMPSLQTIQDETFQRMSQYTQGSWDQASSENRNYHVFPLVLKMRNYFTLIKLFQTTELERYYSPDKYLERPHALARIFDKLQNTSNAELAFPNAIFHDRRLNLWRYLDDLKNRYHTEAYEMSFDPQNEQSVTEKINDWISKVTNGRQPKKHSYSMKKMHHLSTFLRFTGCWESTKSHLISFVTSERRKRFIPAISETTTTLKFKGVKEGNEIHWFNGRGTIGYYKDTNKKFEAIRIPFKNEEFAMVVMLPYSNQTMRTFKYFTASDYRQLLQRVNETYEPVEYTIPVMNSSTILINEDGASINGGECGHAEVSEERTTTDIHYRPFIVDRPFGLIIYHEKSMLVLMHAFVRNPLSRSWPASKYYVLIDA